MVENTIFEIRGADQVDSVAREAAAIARMHHFNQLQAEELSLLVSELAVNLVKFAGEGQIRIGPFQFGGNYGIDLFSFDRGPGMADAGKALRDGYSTSGSMGTGLGAVRRLSDEFDLFSIPQPEAKPRGGGMTVVFSRKWRKGSDSPLSTGIYQTGFFTRPLPGEERNGDGLFIRQNGSELTVAVIDGLGHGEEASVAAQAAVEYLENRPEGSVELWLRELHTWLRHTRGAVVAIAQLDRPRRKLIYGGIGNITARVLNSPHPVHPVSMNGTVGGKLNRIRAFEFDWVPGTTLVLSSDGISNKWDPADFPGLTLSHPAIISLVIGERYCRQTDDAALVVVR